MEVRTQAHQFISQAPSVGVIPGFVVSAPYVQDSHQMDLSSSREANLALMPRSSNRIRLAQVELANRKKKAKTSHFSSLDKRISQAAESSGAFSGGLHSDADKVSAGDWLSMDSLANADSLVSRGDNFEGLQPTNFSGDAVRTIIASPLTFFN